MDLTRKCLWRTTIHLSIIWPSIPSNAILKELNSSVFQVMIFFFLLWVNLNLIFSVKMWRLKRVIIERPSCHLQIASFFLLISSKILILWKWHMLNSLIDNAIRNIWNEVTIIKEDLEQISNLPSHQGSPEELYYSQSQAYKKKMSGVNKRFETNVLGHLVWCGSAMFLFTFLPGNTVWSPGVLAA